MQIIIVDGSSDNNPCREYVKSIAYGNTFALFTQNNIGHGRGICLALEYVQTPFVLLFDCLFKHLHIPIPRAAAPRPPSLACHNADRMQAALE